jgi:hypothetical protein
MVVDDVGRVSSYDQSLSECANLLDETALPVYVEGEFRLID